MVSNKYQGDNNIFLESIDQCQIRSTKENKTKNLGKIKIEEAGRA